MGDFNSHSTLWGCSSTNQKGLKMEKFMMQNLCLLNNKSATYLHPGTGTLSSLDLAFCNPTLYLNFIRSVLTDLYGSDDYPTVVAKPLTEAVDDCERWRLTGADWDLFRDLCGGELRLTAAEVLNNALNQY
jgi:Endonuclease-reverse transcriptase